MYQQMEKTDNEHYEEDENLKKLAIEEFSKFVENHKFIRQHQSDELMILSFLRARRYVMPKAKELYERACLFVKQNPDICEIDEGRFNKVMELYDSGAIEILKERDAFGRRILFCSTRKFDTSKCTVDDAMRLFTMIHCVLSLESDTQKYGIVFINDLTGVSASHLKLFPYKMLANYSSFMNISVLRIKEIYVVGMPGFAVQLFKAIRYVLDEKNRNRLRVMSDIENLWKYVSQDIMTKENGGLSYSNTETLSDFKNTILTHKNKIFEMMNNFDVDIEKARKFHKVKTEKSKKSSREDRGLLEFD